VLARSYFEHGLLLTDVNTQTHVYTYTHTHTHTHTHIYIYIYIYIYMHIYIYIYICTYIYGKLCLIYSRFRPGHQIPQYFPRLSKEIQDTN